MQSFRLQTFEVENLRVKHEYPKSQKKGFIKEENQRRKEPLGRIHKYKVEYARWKVDTFYQDTT